MSLPLPTTWAEIPVYVRETLHNPFYKRADGVPGLSHLADVMGWRAGDLNAMWGGPRPLTNTLVGAGLGSLGGYAAGRLAETVLPKRYFEPGAARKRGLILGAALGGLPGAYQSFAALRANDGDPDALMGQWPEVLSPKAASEVNPNDPWFKAAQDLFAPRIPVDQFNRNVFADQNTPPRYQAALAGSLEAADAISDRDRFISVWDVGRIAAGAGVGLASGIIAGKAIQLLAGLTPDATRKIQDAGLWAGAVKAVVPQILGFR